MGKISTEYFLSAVSFIFVSILGIYIINARNGSYAPVWTFWLSIILIFILIISQILTLDGKKSNHDVLLLLQIFVTALLIRLLFISTGEVLAGYDAYNEYIRLSKISVQNRWIPDQMGYPSNYPVLYIFFMVWSQITGMDLFVTAKWLPMSFFFLTALFIYLITYSKYVSKKAAFLACFGFSFLFISLFFHTAIQRETIVLPLFVSTIYLYYNAIGENDRKFTYLFLAILTSIMSVLSHYLTSFLLLIFFATFLLINRIMATKFVKFLPIRVRAQKQRISAVFVFFLFTCELSYWILLNYSPFKLIWFIVKESAITDPGVGATVPNLLRYQILWWGEILFAIMFTLLSIYALFLREKQGSSDVALLVFSGLVSVLMVLTIGGRVLPQGSMGLGSRFETFVYVGLFILSGYATKAVSQVSKIPVKKLIVVIFLAFALLNIYRISPDLYSECQPQMGEPRHLISEGEATALKFPKLGADARVIGDFYLRGFVELSKYLSESQAMNTNSTFIVHSCLMPYLTESYIAGAQTNTTLNKIYDGAAAIYRLQLPNGSS